MNNIEIINDTNSEMLSTKVNGNTIFFGNYWDFNVPEDISKLLKSVETINLTEENKSIED